jgi:glycosyltransferase involved in cell wall biosynthesis
VSSLLRALDGRNDDHEYFIYAPTWNDVPPLGPRFHVRRSRVPRGSPAARTMWDLTVPAIAAAREPVDLIHYLHPALAAFSPGRPMIMNLLDAIGWVVPGYRQPQPYQWLERRAAHRADLVLTLSESARADLENVLGLPSAKIRVTYLGAPPLDPEPSSPLDPGSPPRKPYFLFVGGTEKRKNLNAVLEAFKSLDGLELLDGLRSPGGLELRVVGPHTATPVHDARREQRGVRWLGFVGAEELVELYRHAIALVFPSRYEGFGLPVLEAMARRTPVIAADRSSLPEVARGAAMLVDPDDVAGLRDAMRRLATEAGLRAELTKRGAEVATEFSWEETAHATVAAYEELCPSP